MRIHRTRRDCAAYGSANNDAGGVRLAHLKFLSPICREEEYTERGTFAARQEELLAMAGKLDDHPLVLHLIL